MHPKITKDDFKRRKYIIRCTEKLFAENGLQGTSTREISKEAANVNITMISYYFGF
ncbi:TetR/AcrR family transcriptional regulator [Chryseobacterium indoltheticum]|uniref:TetR/AcrR family transcriptional regulator n=1 Tax=Chryseobacterium indoltheticum TaxID=254 RepID=UPI003F494A75